MDMRHVCCPDSLSLEKQLVRALGKLGSFNSVLLGEGSSLRSYALSDLSQDG